MYVKSGLHKNHLSPSGQKHQKLTFDRIKIRYKLTGHYTFFFAYHLRSEQANLSRLHVRSPFTSICCCQSADLRAIFGMSAWNDSHSADQLACSFIFSAVAPFQHKERAIKLSMSTEWRCKNARNFTWCKFSSWG